ncbi:MAG TPA: class I SAM-dependent methyltransferase [Terriglobia bacterium]|nr:class I SAM-dependent methyltransferase [Terriglobia bacterium]
MTIPGMTPEELHNIYAAEESFWWYQGMRAITHAVLDREPAIRAGTGLDAGCGTGYNAVEMANRFGCKMYGLDLERLALGYARRRGLARAVQGSILELPFAAESFDLLTSFDVLPHLARGQEAIALAEFSRVLRPGGWLLLRVAAFDLLRSRHSQFVSERQRFRAGTLLRSLRQASLAPVHWTYANSLLSPVAFFKFRVWEPLRGAPPASGVAAALPAWLNRSLRWILRCEARYIRRGWRFVFGQSLLVLARKQPFRHKAGPGSAGL